MQEKTEVWLDTISPATEEDGAGQPFEGTGNNQPDDGAGTSHPIDGTGIADPEATKN